MSIGVGFCGVRALGGVKVGVHWPSLAANQEIVSMQIKHHNGRVGLIKHYKVFIIHNGI
jgi:hypothetical protein